MVVKKWVEEHNNLVLQYQETITLIKNSKKTVQDKHIEQAKKAIKKHKPELGERAEAILLERASVLQREEESIQSVRKIHEENEQKQLKERNFRAEWNNTYTVLIENKPRITIFRLNAFLKIIMMIFIEKERLNHCKEILFLILIT